MTLLYIKTAVWEFLADAKYESIYAAICKAKGDSTQDFSANFTATNSVSDAVQHITAVGCTDVWGH